MSFATKTITLCILLFSTLLLAQTGGTGRPPDGLRTDLKKFKKPISLSSKIMKDQIKISAAISRLRKNENDLLKTMNENSSPTCTASSPDFKDFTEMHMTLALSSSTSEKKVPDCYDCSVNGKADSSYIELTKLGKCLAKLPKVRDGFVNFMKDEYILIYLSKQYGYTQGQVDFLYNYYDKLFEETNKKETGEKN